MLMYTDLWWLLLIDADWRWLMLKLHQVFFCWSVPQEFLIFHLLTVLFILRTEIWAGFWCVPFIAPHHQSQLRSEAASARTPSHHILIWSLPPVAITSITLGLSCQNFIFGHDLVPPIKAILPSLYLPTNHFSVSYLLFTFLFNNFVPEGRPWVTPLMTAWLPPILQKLTRYLWEVEKYAIRWKLRILSRSRFKVLFGLISRCFWISE